MQRKGSGRSFCIALLKGEMMAWDWFINLEPVALEGARHHAMMMSDDNYTDRFLDVEGKEREPDRVAFLNNFKNGFMACVLMSAYFESCLNSLLRDVVGLDSGDKSFRAKEDDKLAILFVNHRGWLNEVKSQSSWRDYKEMKRMRNALVHYKQNCCEVMSGEFPLGGWVVEGLRLDEFFTKKSIEKYIEQTLALVNRIAIGLNVSINQDVTPISCGSRYFRQEYFISEGESGAVVIPED